MSLSFSSFMGLSSPTTTKMKGMIRKGTVLFMLDSGATHNFITPRLAKRLKLTEKVNSHLHILLGTGVSVKGTSICEKVSFTIQGWTFTTDFITLELGQVNAILVVQWLRTLGDCQVNWKTQELSFQYKDQHVRLVGDSNVQYSQLTIHEATPTFVNELFELEQENQSLTQHNIQQLPTEIEKALSSYQHVFEEPSGLL